MKKQLPQTKMLNSMRLSIILMVYLRRLLMKSQLPLKKNKLMNLILLQKSQPLKNQLMQLSQLKRRLKKHHLRLMILQHQPKLKKQRK